MSQRKKGREEIGYDGNKHVKGLKYTQLSAVNTLPVNVILGPANEHDSRKLFPLMNGINIATGAHRPKKRPKHVFADLAYDTFLVRLFQGERSKLRFQKRSKKKHAGRPFDYDKEAYKKYRSSVERFFGWLKGGFHRLEVRHERLSSTFIGLIQIACFIIHWRVFG
jgi:transposase